MEAITQSNFAFQQENFEEHHQGPAETREVPGVNRIKDVGRDVLNLIFEHFDPHPCSKTAFQSRNDLLSAAITCKAFTEPAMNSLWKVLPSLLPVVHLIPLLVAEVIKGQYLVDNIPLAKWERFEIYARRVRTLYMEPGKVIPPALCLLIRDMYGSPLLPYLKAIYIPNKKAIDFNSVMSLALGASLDVVELHCGAISEKYFFNTFLALLASKSPHLRHLAVRGAGNASLDILQTLTKIQRLEIRLSDTHLYSQILQRLEKLVDLQDLTLDEIWKLRRLHVIGIPNSIIRVLDDIDLTNLTAVVIDESFDSSGDQTQGFWNDCFRRLSICLTIEDIEINQLNHPRGHAHYSFPTSWFRPLMDLNNVKSLIIKDCELSGSDEDFRAIAVGFPKLKKLVVPTASYAKGKTLACLSYFSQYCPDLYEIKICIEHDIVKNLDAINQLPYITDHHNPLQKLYVNSEFREIQTIQMIQVAQFLDLLFPNLFILETYGSDTMEALIWTGIQQTRVALRAARINALRRVKS